MPYYTSARGRKEYSVAKKSYRHLTMRIPHEDWDEIVGFATEQGLSYAESIRTLITWGLDNANEARRCQPSKPLHKPSIGDRVHSDRRDDVVQSRKRD